MKCPQCDHALERVAYEDVPVMQCSKCSGYFVAQNRLRLIKSSRDQNPAALQDEAQTESVRDTSEPIKCPKCLVDRMKKQKVQVDDEVSFFLDVCPRCKHTWFDGGELARMQLKYEQSAKAVDEFARQTRLEEMPEEQREQLDQRIDTLEKSEGLLESFAIQWLLRGAIVILFVATFWSLFSSQSALWSGIFSGALAGLFISIIIPRSELTNTQRLNFSILVGLAEACYLVYLIFFY